MTISKLWQQIVAEQHLTVRQCTRDGKPVNIPRWPPESIKLANECARLAAELERLRCGNAPKPPITRPASAESIVGEVNE